MSIHHSSLGRVGRRGNPTQTTGQGLAHDQSTLATTTAASVCRSMAQPSGAGSRSHHWLKAPGFFALIQILDYPKSLESMCLLILVEQDPFLKNLHTTSPNLWLCSPTYTTTQALGKDEYLFTLQREWY